jgi:hypothetical protein
MMCTVPKKKTSTTYLMYYVYEKQFMLSDIDSLYHFIYVQGIP